MNKHETTQLLRTRSALTSQPYGDETIDAWHTALAKRTLEECRPALQRAARNNKRITIADIIEQLSPHTVITPPDRPEPGCTCSERICDMHKQRGYAELARIRAEILERRTAR